MRQSTIFFSSSPTKLHGDALLRPPRRKLVPIGLHTVVGVSIVDGEEMIGMDYSTRNRIETAILHILTESDIVLYDQEREDIVELLAPRLERAYLIGTQAWRLGWTPNDMTRIALGWDRFVASLENV